MATLVTSISPSSDSTERTASAAAPPDRAGDHHDLGTVDLPLDDFAELFARRC